MKKLLLSTALLTSLLVGCSDDEATPVTEEKEPVATAPVEEATPVEETSPAKETAPTKDAESTEKSSITPEQVQETLTTIEENAKKDEQLKDVKVEETEDTINVTVEFEKDATDEEKGLFLLNYQIMLNAAHPDKELKFDIKE